MASFVVLPFLLRDFETIYKVTFIVEGLLYITMILHGGSMKFSCREIL